MGSDKGMIKLLDKSWVQSAADKMAQLNIPVKISVNAQQVASYTEQFLMADVIVDNTALPVKGPLLGTLSGHLAYPAETIFVLACDMPFMEVAILRSLYQLWQTQTADAYVFTNDGQAEPLCGIYTGQGLASIYTLLQNGLLQKHSMKYMLDHLEVKKLPVSTTEKKYFSNINTHAALNGL